jgi:hypothetical protein
MAGKLSVSIAGQDVLISGSGFNGSEIRLHVREPSGAQHEHTMPLEDGSFSSFSVSDAAPGDWTAEAHSIKKKDKFKKVVRKLASTTFTVEGDDGGE